MINYTSLDMQKESEADSGLYSDINRSIGKKRKKTNMFLFKYYYLAPAEVENVFDESTTVGPQNTANHTLNPAIEPDQTTTEDHTENQREPDSVSKKDEKSMTPARRWAAIR